MPPATNTDPLAMATIGAGGGSQERSRLILPVTDQMPLPTSYNSAVARTGTQPVQTLLPPTASTLPDNGPLAMKVMKAASVILIEGVPMGSSPAPYAMIAHFEFASSEALKAALADPAMAEVRADVAKFTDIKPTVMLGKSL